MRSIGRDANGLSGLEFARGHDWPTTAALDENSGGKTNFASIR